MHGHLHSSHVLVNRSCTITIITRHRLYVFSVPIVLHQYKGLVWQSVWHVILLQSSMPYHLILTTFGLIMFNVTLVTFFTNRALQKMTDFEFPWCYREIIACLVFLVRAHECWVRAIMSRKWQITFTWRQKRPESNIVVL